MLWRFVMDSGAIQNVLLLLLLLYSIKTAGWSPLNNKKKCNLVLFRHVSAVRHLESIAIR
jgi:hypothetical protein